MKFISLGHQSWFFNNKNTSILIDPILSNYFGYSRKFKHCIYPQREIDDSLIKSVNFAILTNDHSDHFHLESLSKLERTCQIIISSLATEALKTACEDLGFKVIRCNLWEPIQLDDFIIYFLSGDFNESIWEARVSPLWVRTYDDSNGLVIQSETLPSQELIDNIRSEKYPTPHTLIVTNNSQLVNQNSVGLSKNIFPLEQPFDNVKQIDLYYKIAYEIPKLIGTPQNIILSGCGFMPSSKYIFDFWNQEELAEIIQSLTLGQNIFGAYPGVQFNIEHSSITKTVTDKIIINDFKLQKYISNNTSEKYSFEHLDTEEIIKYFSTDLKQFAKCFLLSKVGKFLNGLNYYLDGFISEFRFCIFLIDSKKNNTVLLKLNYRTAEFEIFYTENLNSAIRKSPLGVIADFYDFFSLFNGESQIWDLSLCDNFNQWYVGKPEYSPFSFLFSYFNEGINPSLFSKIYSEYVNQATV